MKVTPTGELSGFIAIERPSTKFDDNGVYSCQVDFTGRDAKAMKKEVDYLLEASSVEGFSKGVKKAADPPYKVENKVLTVKFKQKARIQTKQGDVYEKKVRLFDASNKEISETLNLGQGSKVRVAYKPYMWAVSALGCGVTLQLEMIQVLDLVAREVGEIDMSSVFGSVEGFTAAKKDEDVFDAPKEDVGLDVDDDEDF